MRGDGAHTHPKAIALPGGSNSLTFRGGDTNHVVS